MKHDLVSDDALLAACKEIGSPDTWGEEREEWTRALGETIRWVRAADEKERQTREFQQRLWEENHVASAGLRDFPHGGEYPSLCLAIDRRSKSEEYPLEGRSPKTLTMLVMAMSISA